MPKDTELIRTIVSIWDPTAWIAKKVPTTTVVDWSRVKAVTTSKCGMPPGIMAGLKNKNEGGEGMVRKGGVHKNTSKGGVAKKVAIHNRG